MTSPAEDRELPRLVRLVVIPLVGVLLTLFFVHRGFPYDVLRVRVESELSRATGARVSVDALEPRLALAGPGLVATGVRAMAGPDQLIDIDRIFLRPAWSLDWLRARPALYVEAAAPFGRAAGVYTAGSEPGWSGDLSQLDLGEISTRGLWRGSGVEGVLDATLDVRLAQDGPVGTVQVEGRDGSLLFPDMPLPVPYSQLSGKLVLGGDAWLQFETFEFQGDLVSGSVTGRVSRGPDFWSAPMDLDVRITADRSLHEPLAALGVRVARNGSARLRITGTPARANVR